MKKILLVAALAIVAIPAFAQEAKKEATVEKKTEKYEHTKGNQVTTGTKETQTERKGNVVTKEVKEEVVKKDKKDLSTAENKDIVTTKRKVTSHHKTVKTGKN